MLLEHAVGQLAWQRPTCSDATDGQMQRLREEAKRSAEVEATGPSSAFVDGCNRLSHADGCLSCPERDKCCEDSPSLRIKIRMREINTVRPN